MTSFGEAAAAQIVAQPDEVTRAALGGDETALELLLGVTAQSAYAAGIAAAGAAVGVSL